MVLTKTWRFFFPSFDTYLKRQHVKNLLPRVVEKKFFCIIYHQTKSDSNVKLKQIEKNTKKIQKSEKCKKEKKKSS